MIASTLTVSPRGSRIDPLEDPRWDEFVLAHPASQVFHRSAWARVLVETYGYQPRYQVLEDGAGNILAGWPAMLVASPITGRRLVTLPFTDHCQPLIRTDEEGEALLTAVLTDAETCRAGRIEVRGWPSGLKPPDSLVAVQGYVRHVIDLSVGPERIFKNAHTNARRGVRRAEREGVTVRLSEDRADLDAFRSLNLNLRRRHGMLPQPSRFFDAIYRHLIRDCGYLLIAEREGKPLAALLCLRHNDVTLDKYAVSDGAEWKYRAPHFAMWKSIEMEAERGSRWYDMGRSDASADGLHWFKEQWGAVSIASPYFYYPEPGGQNMGDPRGLKKRGLDLFSRVAPRGLFELAGRVAYRHLG